MPLEGHWERQNTPLRRLTRREGRIVAVVAVVVALGGGAALYASLTSSTPRPAPGCISVTAASTMGAGQFQSCGAAAARICAAQAGRNDEFARSVLASCRQAGIASRR